MKPLRLVSILFAITCVASCSVYMAAHQPGQKDMTACKPGAHQSVVRTELGTPVWTGKENDCDVEIYRFIQGYSQGAKAGRAVFHGAADILTLGMWEVVGTPVESIASGDKTTVKVYYNENMYVTKVEVHTEAPPPPSESVNDTPATVPTHK